MLHSMDEGGVGQHDLDLGHLAAAEADAAIHREPALFSRLTIAVEVEVHADFARPAKRQEGQFAVFCVHKVSVWSFSSC